ncbi:MAG: hypothetical protein ACRBBV_05815 [Paracoccaceae bacterium]
MKHLVKAWGMLVLASALTTALTAALSAMPAAAAWLGPDLIAPDLIAAILIALALMKSRVILSDYLELSQAPRIRAGVMAAFFLWAAVALLLIIAA